jgi:hypothetical protein
MSRHQSFIFGLCLSAAVVFAQTLPPTLLPAANRPGYAGFGSANQPVRRTSHLNGKDYVSILEQPTVSREWEPSATLPLTLPAAERAARLELSKIVPNDSEWVATDFQISRFGAGPNWYYAVTLQPVLQLLGGPIESFTALLDFAGKPGRVLQLGPNQVPR